MQKYSTHPINTKFSNNFFLLFIYLIIKEIKCVFASHDKKINPLLINGFLKNEYNTYIYVKIMDFCSFLTFHARSLKTICPGSRAWLTI